MGTPTPSNDWSSHSPFYPTKGAYVEAHAIFNPLILSNDDYVTNPTRGLSIEPREQKVFRQRCKSYIYI
jgi:hypothetical protein